MEALTLQQELKAHGLVRENKRNGRIDIVEIVGRGNEVLAHVNFLPLVPKSGRLRTELVSTRVTRPKVRIFLVIMALREWAQRTGREEDLRVQIGLDEYNSFGGRQDLLHNHETVRLVSEAGFNLTGVEERKNFDGSESEQQIFLIFSPR